MLLTIMLLFEWTAFVGPVRAEFLRGRNFEYVRAARALGLSNTQIMFKHILPNAMVATVTFAPFILNGAITALTALDYLGFGLPPVRRRSASCSSRANRTCRRHGWPDRVFRHRDHAEPGRFRRRGGPRRPRSAQDDARPSSFGVIA